MFRDHLYSVEREYTPSTFLSDAARAKLLQRSKKARETREEEHLKEKRRQGTGKNEWKALEVANGTSKQENKVIIHNNIYFKLSVKFDLIILLLK